MSKAGQTLLGPLGAVPACSDITEQKAGDITLPKLGDPSFVVYTPQDQRDREQDVLATWNSIFRYSG